MTIICSKKFQSIILKLMLLLILSALNLRFVRKGWTFNSEIWNNDNQMQMDSQIQINPLTPTLYLPLDNDTIHTITPVFEWSSFQDGGDGETQAGYQLRVICDTDGDLVIYDTGLISSFVDNTHIYSSGFYSDPEPRFTDTFDDLWEETNSSNSIWRKSGPWAILSNNTYLYQENVCIENSKLILTVPENKLEGGQIESINSTFHYGFYEVRIRASEVPGVVNAFFMWCPFNNNNEIDIEFLSNEFGPGSGRVHFVLHPHEGLTEDKYHKTVDLPFNPSDDFNNYAFLWTQNSVEFYVNSDQVALMSVSQGSPIPSEAGNLLISNWSGGNQYWGGGPPSSSASMEVEWIRHVPENGEGKISFPLEWEKHYHWYVRYLDSGGDWSDWGGDESSDYQDFYIETANDTPVVSDIPDQTVDEGGSFEPVLLDNYVSDSDNTEEEMTWTWSGNNELTVTIDENRIAAIRIPYDDWNGFATITFTAFDPGGLSSSYMAMFTVTSVNDTPFVSDIPDTVISEGKNFLKINLDNYVTDVDNGKDELVWTLSGNVNLSIDIDENRYAIIAMPDTNWFGSEMITFTATDPGGLYNSDEAIFTVTPVNDPPVISDFLPDSISFYANTSFSLNIWDNVYDVETPDSLLNYQFLTADECLICAYNDSTGILTLSAVQNFSGVLFMNIKITDDSSAAAECFIRVTILLPAGIEDSFPGRIPEEFVLMQNFPNPFNPVTHIDFGLPRVSDVRLEVFNYLGQRINVLMDKRMLPGYHIADFNASQLASGFYFYRFEAEDFVKVKKMLLMR